MRLRLTAFRRRARLRRRSVEPRGPQPPLRAELRRVAWALAFFLCVVGVLVVVGLYH